MLEVNQIYNEDCLIGMSNISDKTIDMILCDLPYGTTACDWDVVIPFDKLWAQYRRIIKDDGAIVLFGREPFTSSLVHSNIKGYKHKWIWNKKQSGSFQNAKYMPLQIEEDIVVFTAKGEKVRYFPIMRKGKMRKKGGAKKQSVAVGVGLGTDYHTYSDDYFPVNIIEFPSLRTNRVHPTQKPIELCEYLIRSYTKEADIVLDNCIGSGTTAIACINTNRKFIGFENEKSIFNIALERIRKHLYLYGTTEQAEKPVSHL